MSANKKKITEDSKSRVVCRNRRARHDYEILHEIECGIMLVGSEVKAIRDNKISIDEGFARLERGEVWLHNCDIAEYPQATYMNHERRRSRKLLLNKREIKKYVEAFDNTGLTLIPLDVHFANGRVKIQLAVAKGRKSHDKRDRIKQNDDNRVIRAAMRKEMQ